jgi:hypothetical protein
MNTKTNFSNQINNLDSTVFKNYLHSIIDLSGHNLDNTFSNLYDTFISEFGHEVKAFGEKNAFMHWTEGLPSCLDMVFYYDDINEFFRSIGVNPSDDDTYNWNIYRLELYKALINNK